MKAFLISYSSDVFGDTEVRREYVACTEQAARARAFHICKMNEWYYSIEQIEIIDIEEDYQEGR